MKSSGMGVGRNDLSEGMQDVNLRHLWETDISISWLVVGRRESWSLFSLLPESGFLLGPMSKVNTCMGLLSSVLPLSHCLLLKIKEC